MECVQTLMECVQTLMECVQTLMECVQTLMECVQTLMECVQTNVMVLGSKNVQFKINPQYTEWGTRCRSWLRHCATSWKVAGSIPDEVSVIFH